MLSGSELLNTVDGATVTVDLLSTRQENTSIWVLYLVIFTLGTAYWLFRRDKRE